MHQVLVSVYDLKSNEYAPPFLQRSTAEAIWTFTSEVNNPKDGNLLFQNPEDFQLFHVGNWFPLSGTIEPVSLFIVYAGSVKQ